MEILSKLFLKKTLTKIKDAAHSILSFLQVYWSFAPIGGEQVTIFAMDGQANGVKVSFELTIMTCELYYE